MRAWVMSALFLIVLSVAPVPASAVSCLECLCASTSAHPSDIFCLETADPIQLPRQACRFSCGGDASNQPNDGACSLQAPNCTPANTATNPPQVSTTPVLSPWALAFVATLLSLIGVFGVRRVRQR